jgi:ribulose-5-phosphate 4-epimerase/fuculose-1-phosphate aldolase
MSEPQPILPFSFVADPLNDLVDANHILYDQGVLDAWGHVSVRDTRKPDRFWLSRSVPPALVTYDDIMELDVDGRPMNQNGRKVYLERFIHAEVYKARPDVMAVVHNHPPAMISFSVTDVPLRPLTGPAGFLGSGVPVFDIRDVDDGPVLIIMNPKQGAALARALGSHAVLLLARHGAVVVGSSLKQVVWRAIYSESNARQQLDALRLGSIKYLSDAEVAYSIATMPPDPERAWTLWKASARRLAYLR